MSLLCEGIIETIATDLHDEAVAKFAQVLADCESTSWAVAQQAHEDVHEMRVSCPDYDSFLAEATEFMVRHDLRPNTWLP